MGGVELRITAELSRALEWVLGALPATPEPHVLLAVYLDALAKGYGLSESMLIDWDPVERAAPPDQALPLIRHHLAGDGALLDANRVRDLLYTVFVDLAQRADVRKTLNNNQPFTDLELLTLGQVYWNLEGTDDRPRLPIRPSLISTRGKAGSQQARTDIPTPRGTGDFATMRWTARVEQGANKSSGQGFRNQGARLAVLAAQHIIDRNPHPAPALGGAILHHSPADGGRRRLTSITWPEDELPVAPAVATPDKQAPAGGAAGLVDPDRSGSAPPIASHPHRVLVGAPTGVGADYQPRHFDAALEHWWADRRERRIWLRGGPGLGKSYTARRVMQQALANQDPERDDLLVWVDSADTASVTQAYTEGVDQLRQEGFAVPGGALDPARALLSALTTSPWRWLIVLDNADPGALIDAGLVPPGVNPNGRVLITTNSRDHRLASNGRVVEAAVFTPEEAEAYLRSDVHTGGHGLGPLLSASTSETAALAEGVGHHPLALSIAAATIVASAMTVTDWINEFTTAETMDAAADAPDRGGYPHLIGATWQVALGRASEGLPDGVVERAAMVAALQNPDGHPTWLWDRPAVAGWVGGGSTLARHHGVPVAVRRLIDSGIVELRGHTWRDGQVAIHQLAARAVREWADPAALADLAGILAEQWLLELTANPDAAQPDVLHRSLRPIAALPDLPAPARRTVTALLAYRQPTGSRVLREMAESLEPYLAVGGATVRIELADQLLGIADEEAALGRAAQARTTYSRAADLYRQLVADTSLTEDELAGCLMRLGDLEERFGEPDQAQASRQRAAALLERLAETASDTRAISRHLADLVTLHDLLGNPDWKARALVRAEELLTRSPDDLPSSADTQAVIRQGHTWRTLAGLMVEAGRLDPAKECLAREAAIYERFPDLWSWTHRDWTETVQQLALLHARTGEWSDAEHHLTRLTDIKQMPWTTSLKDETAERLSSGSQRDARVLLASVQAHLGRREDTDQNLARAAEDYEEPTSDDFLSLADWLDSLARESPRESVEFERLMIEDLQSHLQSVLRISLMGMAIKSAEKGRLEEALGLSGSLLDLAQQGADAAPGDEQAEGDLAAAHEAMGAVRHDQGVFDDAAMHFARAVDIRQMLAELDPSRVEAQRNLAQALRFQAKCLAGAGRHQAAAESLTRSVSAYRRVTERVPDNRENASSLATALNELAETQAELGNLDAAVDCYEESISVLRILADQTPDDHTAQTALADALMRLGSTCLTHGQPEAAEEPLRRSIDVYSAVVARRPDDHQTRQQLAWTRALLGWALTQTDRPHEALVPLNEAVTTHRALTEHAPDDRPTQTQLALTLALLGEAHSAAGHKEQAADCLSRSANTLQLLADLDPAERPDMLIHVLNEIAPILRDLGRTDEADTALTRANDLARSFPEEDSQDDP